MSRNLISDARIPERSYKVFFKAICHDDGFWLTAPTSLPLSLCFCFFSPVTIVITSLQHYELWIFKLTFSNSCGLHFISKPSVERERRRAESVSLMTLTSAAGCCRPSCTRLAIDKRDAMYLIHTVACQTIWRNLEFEVENATFKTQTVRGKADAFIFVFSSGSDLRYHWKPSVPFQASLAETLYRFIPITDWMLMFQLQKMKSGEDGICKVKENGQQEISTDEVNKTNEQTQSNSYSVNKVSIPHSKLFLKL